MNISGFDLTHTLAFVFDLDGTLVQSEYVWLKAKDTVAKKNGLKLTEADPVSYTHLTLPTILLV